MTLTNEEKINHAQTRKEEGNEAFKQGNLTEALRGYHEAILYLSGIEAGSGTQGGLNAAMASSETSNKSIDDEQDPLKKEVRMQLSLCYSNLAACLIKQEKWDRAIDNCNKALQKNENNTKARFRRAQALISKKEHTDLDKAKQDLDILAKADPNDPAVKRERIRLREREKAADLKQKKEFAGMFDRYAKAEEKAEQEAKTTSTITETESEVISISKESEDGVKDKKDI